MGCVVRTNTLFVVVSDAGDHKLQAQTILPVQRCIHGTCLAAKGNGCELCVLRTPGLFCVLSSSENFHCLHSSIPCRLMPWPPNITSLLGCSSAMATAVARPVAASQIAGLYAFFSCSGLVSLVVGSRVVGCIQSSSQGGSSGV